jgi:hypothetical protein
VLRWATPRARASGLLASGVVLAVLMLASHAASFGFAIAGGRLLSPADFGILTALLGIVLVGMAPGMAVQALTAAGTLGGPVTIDARLARRLALGIGGVVAALMGVLGPAIGTTHPVTVLSIAGAAAVLPLTAAKEGVLQGQGRFVALGAVLFVGATVKLSAGLVGMGTTHAVWAAAVGIGLGYLAQLRLSHRLTGGLHVPPRGQGLRLTSTVVTAVTTMALLLALVHVDAVLAPILLEDLLAGQYAVGVTGARIVFWGPQFAVFLLYPRLVIDDRRRVVVVAIAGLTVAGALGAVVAGMIGPWLVESIFGARFAPIGAELWRFAWFGTAILGLQILALSDLATGRRESMWLLAAALAAVVGVVLGRRPTDPGTFITTVAGIVTGFLVVGAARRLTHPARALRARPVGAEPT